MDRKTDSTVDKGGYTQIPPDTMEGNRGVMLQREGRRVPLFAKDLPSPNLYLLLGRQRGRLRSWGRKQLCCLRTWSSRTRNPKGGQLEDQVVGPTRKLFLSYSQDFFNTAIPCKDIHLTQCFTVKVQPPDRPLSTAEWRQLRETLGNPERFDIHMMGTMFTYGAKLDIAKWEDDECGFIGKLLHHIFYLCLLFCPTHISRIKNTGEVDVKTIEVGVCVTGHCSHL